MSIKAFITELSAKLEGCNSYIHKITDAYEAGVLQHGSTAAFASNAPGLEAYLSGGRHISDGMKNIIAGTEFFAETPNLGQNEALKYAADALNELKRKFRSYFDQHPDYTKENNQLKLEERQLLETLAEAIVFINGQPELQRDVGRQR